MWHSFFRSLWPMSLKHIEQDFHLLRSRIYNELACKIECDLMKINDPIVEKKSIEIPTRILAASLQAINASFESQILSIHNSYSFQQKILFYKLYIKTLRQLNSLNHEYNQALSIKPSSPSIQKRRKQRVCDAEYQATRRHNGDFPASVMNGLSKSEVGADLESIRQFTVATTPPIAAPVLAEKSDKIRLPPISSLNLLKADSSKQGLIILISSFDARSYE